MASSELEKRLTALEEEVFRLKLLVQKNQPAKNWKAIIGTFLNDPYYEKAMKYGRKYRESLRPKPRKNRKRKDGDSGSTPGK